MASQLTADDFKQSLNGHLAIKGAEIFAKWGPAIGWKELQQILADRAFCRYPCVVEFDAANLGPGEFALPVQKGDRPEEGFTMYVHPVFLMELSRVPYLVLYQLVVVNYGEFATADDAETFGSAALGISKDEYYDSLCRLAGEIDPCCGE